MDENAGNAKTSMMQNGAKSKTPGSGSSPSPCLSFLLSSAKTDSNKEK